MIEKPKWLWLYIPLLRRTHYVFWLDEKMSALYLAEGSNHRDVFSVAAKLKQATDITLVHPSK